MSWRAVLCAGLAMLLAACASDRPKPKPLEKLAPQRADRVVWSVRGGDMPAPLRAAVAAQTVVTVTQRGELRALDAETGKPQWQADTGTRIAAGVGSDGQTSAVVSTGNELLVYERASLRWRAMLDTRVVTPPLVAGERVFVLGIDRSVSAFDAKDGRPLWTLPRSGDPLTLAQPGVLQAFQDYLFVGVGTRLTALDSVRGAIVKDWVMATPRGVNEVERLADLVGPAARFSDAVCVRAYQAAVGCLDVRSGKIAWTRPTGGYAGLAALQDQVVGIDAVDRVTAWSRSDGQPAWTHDSLLYRELGAPGATADAVVFGDSQGWLHFLSPKTGQALLRLPTDGGAITAAPVRAGRTLIVTTAKGGVYGIRADQVPPQ